MRFIRVPTTRNSPRIVDPEHASDRALRIAVAELLKKTGLRIEATYIGRHPYGYDEYRVVDASARDA